MKDSVFWENLFNSSEAVWGNIASDSALHAVELFREAGVKHVFIPGIGYGRNAKVFLDSNMIVSGVEIANSAIKIARKSMPAMNIFNASVLDMPFDSSMYDGIYCYALLHLFNKTERKKIINNCYNQLAEKGLMYFAVISSESSMYGEGRLISKNRFRLNNGLKVYFYDEGSLQKEFSDYNIIELKKIYEPVKFKENEDPLPFLTICCSK